MMYENIIKTMPGSDNDRFEQIHLFFFILKNKYIGQDILSD